MPRWLRLRLAAAMHPSEGGAADAMADQQDGVAASRGRQSARRLVTAAWYSRVTLRGVRGGGPHVVPNAYPRRASCLVPWRGYGSSGTIVGEIRVDRLAGFRDLPRPAVVSEWQREIRALA